MSKIKLGVSSCLLGQSVRFDGGHKRQAWMTEMLTPFFEFIPVCPETGVGLPTPRQALRLVGDTGAPRIVGNKTPELDLTEALQGYGARMAQQLDDICGYIVKKDSPSCGMERVRVYAADGPPRREGVGIYTQALMQAKPWLPLEEEGRLNDAALRENFFERVFVCHRWQRLLQRGLTPARLIEFHAAHKYMLMARDPHGYRELGRLLARAGCAPLAGLAEDYFLALMAALKQCASRKRHANVLYHLLGYFKRHLLRADKQELVALIEDYREGMVPLLAPITLLRHHLRRRGNAYLERQWYFEPYPRQLMLGAHI